MDEAFIEHLMNTKSPATVSGYSKDMQAFERWFLEANGRELTPELLTQTDVREYRQHMVDTKLAPQTINRRLSALEAYAGFHGHKIETRRARTARPEIHWLDKGQQAALWREIERDRNAARTPAATIQAVRNAAVVGLLLGTGLRISELCALDLDDIQVNSRSGSVKVRHGKGDKSRTVPLNADVRKALQAWLTIRPPAAGPWLFVGQRGERLKQTGVSGMIAEYARVAKVAATAHALRHTFAKNLINMGVGIEQVAMLMGHDSLETTRLYTLPSQADLAKAVERLAQ
jgi:site-specific recombinase XerD